MIDATLIPQTALKYDVEVNEEGRVELHGPFSPGERIIVFVVKETIDIFYDLLEAAQSNLDFWDNPFDDEDWNNA
jgi:hypothetical protein